MEDEKIVGLYFDRSEEAISETEKKYGSYCKSIARSILDSEQDAEECVNDAYLAAWNTIPPAKPNRLSTYLGKLIRNGAISRMVHNRAEKRSSNAMMLLDELSELIADPESESPIEDEIALRDSINRFISGLSEKNRAIFVQRYFHMQKTRQIADAAGLKEASVRSTLYRLRDALREHLQKENIEI